MFIKKLHTPEGVKDYLPKEAALRIEIETKVAKVFKAFGYESIKTPTFEYEEVYENKGSISEKNMYKFVDADGSVLALRPDMTPAIARVAATSFDSDQTLRLCYFEDMFRSNINYRGKQREFTQAGVELIGEKSIYADAEVIILAIESVLATGIEDFKIEIGHSWFQEGLLEELKCSKDIKEKIIKAINNKDYVRVSELSFLSQGGEKIKNIMKRLPFLIGGKEVIKNIEGTFKNEKSEAALTYLKELYSLLENMGYGKYISFDLSVIGTMDYYTGLIFRGYTPGIGFSIIDGGRYDHLLSDFGTDLPAVGFAFKVNDIMSVMVDSYKEEGCIYVYAKKENLVKAYKYAAKLRKKGEKVIVSVKEASEDDKKPKNAKEIVIFGEE